MHDLTHPTARETAGPADPGYNYPHVRPEVFLTDLRLTVTGGPEPGAHAPDFELSSTDGDRVRLSQLRGRPVVLIFGSVT